MATPELRHMLRDDDLNHEEQKQVLELAIKFHKNRFYHQPFAGPQGIAVMFVSSELPEIINMCDNVCVIKAGKMTGMLGREELDQERIMQYAAGGEE